MSFNWPNLLWVLLMLPAAVAGYAWLLRRRRAQAVVYPSLSLIRPALGPHPGWRRHVPPALMLAALAAAIVGAARPNARITLPADYLTLVMALDTSRSMLAEDVPPNRIKAAQDAAQGFLKSLPANVRVGIVSFAATAQVAQNVTDQREELAAAIDRFQLQRGTATGSGLLMALSLLLPDAGIDLESAIYTPGFGGTGPHGARSLDRPTAPKASPMDKPPVPVGSYTAGAIVLLSDGRRTSGPDPLEAARLAAHLGVRVYTVAFGTPDGFIPGMEGYSFFVRVDEETLQAVAGITGGEFFKATNANDLAVIYEKLSSRFSLEKRDTEISVLFALCAVVLSSAAGVLSLLWLRRPAT